MTTKLSAGLLSILVFLAASAPAYAITISSDMQGDISADIVSVKTSASVDAEVKSEQNANLSGNGSAEAGDAVVITRADVEANAIVPANVSVSAVNSEADLSGFVAAQMKADPNIAAVETSSNEVIVTYQTPAKLFGIFPITVHTTAVVSADGSVDVSYPWYSFLLLTNEADLETRLQTVVKTEFGAAVGAADGMANTSVGANAGAVGALSNAMQAKLVSDIRAVLQAAAEASVSADASANVQ